MSYNNVGHAQNSNSSLNFNNIQYGGGGGVGVASSSINVESHHSLPSLRIKTNELFYKWFSEGERSDQIKEVINYIKTTNKIPKLNDLQTFKNNAFPIGSTSNSEKNLQPSPNQVNNNYGTSKNNNNSNNYNFQIPQQNQQQHPQQHQSFINRSKSPTNRSKSPPSMQSPPMSPVGRMPISPKSPRHRQSNILMNINLNNSNNNNNNNNTANTNNGSYPKIANLALQFNKDQPRSQSPNSTTPRDLNEKSNNNLKITTTPSNVPTVTSNIQKTSAGTNQIKTLLQQHQQQQQQQVQQPTIKNEKEIQIQRISSNQLNDQQNGTKQKLITTNDLSSTSASSPASLKSPTSNN
jgi:hypothetical protein